MSNEIQNLEEQLFELKKQLAEKRRNQPREEVLDYEFDAQGGEKIKLSELFGSNSDLIVVHNMGKSCPYCTMWADGFNGLVEHLNNRAPFVVCSPDSPDVQREFAHSRGWRFKMISDSGNFTKDMGFASDEGYAPGFSTFVKGDDRKIYRIASAWFGPGDDFCSAWHFFAVLADGINSWNPKIEY